MKELIKKIAPKWAINFYHLILANLGALIYGFPSDKLIVIGVTGTKGKSTTSYLIAKLLESAGYKVGLTSTIIFKIGKKEWLNDKKMTMLGRFGLQKMLREMVRAGCKYAVIETSSEGIAQHRNAGISYDIALFTNLSPEHLESHGSYDKYRAAKGKLFQGLAYGKKKDLPAVSPGATKPERSEGFAAVREAGIFKTAVINLDDPEADYFLKFNSQNVGFTLNNSYKKSAKEIISAEAVVVKDGGSEFKIGGVNFKTKLLGKFNVYNIVGALSVCKTLGVDLKGLKKSVAAIDAVPGRMEFINEGQNFSVIVDYAHEPASLKALYSIVREITGRRVIHIFGGTGGGRDKARRPVMGEIADQNSQIIILTNDDPYGEDEMKIISDIKKGIAKKKEGESLYIIPDRAAAIQKAVKLAGEGSPRFGEAGDIILITGKGCEQKMAVAGKMIPWDDREVARKALLGLQATS